MGRRKIKKRKPAVAEKGGGMPRAAAKATYSLPAWAPFLFALLLYAGTAGHDYVLDDGLVILKNEQVQQGLTSFPDIVSSNFLNGVNGFNDGLYRPLVILSFALEHQLAGNSPALSHIVNILLYGLCGFFLFLLLKLFFKEKTWIASMVITLLFLAHPVHTEVVANIKGRDEILCFLNFTLSGIFLFRYIDSDRPYKLFASLFFFLLALCSKESAFTLCVALPLMLYFSRDVSRKKMLLTGSAFLTLAALMWLWRTHVIQSMEQEVDTGIVSSLNNSLLAAPEFSGRLATGLYLQLLYFWKLVFPHPLLHDYSYNQIPPISMGSVKAILAILALAAGAMLTATGFKGKKLASFALAFYFITFAATANLFVYIGATFAERFLFLPSLGFVMLLFALFPTSLHTGQQQESISAYISNNKLFSSLIIVLLFVYSVKTIGRNADWKDNFSLFAADMPYLKQSARAHYNYGTALYEQSLLLPAGDARKRNAYRAASELKKAIAIYPAYYDAMNNLGNAYKTAGMLDSSIAVFSRLCEEAPAYSKAYMNLGLSYFENEDYKKAISYLEKYLKIYPESDRAAYTIGIAYGNLQLFDQAIFYLSKARQINPSNINAMKDLGAVYGMKGEHQKALDISLKAYKLDAKDINLLRNIALTYRFLGDEKKSDEFLLKARALDPSVTL